MNGSTGVSVFFVLSGFLITYLLITEIERYGALDVKKFYVRRFLRIWPLYFAVIAFSFLIYPYLKSIFWVNNPLGSNFWYHVTFLSNFDLINLKNNYVGLDAMSQNITWSVSIEEQFYLIWPLIFLLPKRAWIPVIVVLLFISMYFRLLHIDDSNVLYFHTISVLPDLLIGGLFSIIIKKFKMVRMFFENSHDLTHLILFIATFLVLYFGTDFIFSDLYPVFGRMVTATLFALIISSQALTQRKSVLVFSNLSFASKWGKMTYGIYLLHPIAITVIDVTLRILNLPYKDSFVTHFLAAMGMFGLTLSLSYLSYHYFENKFLLLKRNFQRVRTDR